jgi:NADH:ubiquinone oxidoreductase subunit K
VTLHAYLMFSLVLFCVGLFGVLARRNLIAILIGVELMLNAVSVNFLSVNYFLAPDPAVGQIIVLFIIGLAAAEVAIALSIVVAVYRKHADIDVDRITELRG